ncbi:MAG: penicillin-binding protein 2 [Bifidobacteriaceae bacterium]|jgi:cell division protein FtsI (penicillin-binding protein 3)|nr:penicillin-binding protein 2 [Bifidobacteriaceae bacterium]
MTRLGQPARRQALMRSIVVIVLAVFAGRLVQLQVINGPEAAAEGQANRMVTTAQPAERGQIISSDGTVLASDVARYEIEANPDIINDTDLDSGQLIGPGAEVLASELAGPLGINQTKLEQMLRETDQDGKLKTWVRLAEHATQEQWDQVRERREAYLKVGKDPGVFGSKHYIRSYPAGTLAGNLIGYQYETEDAKRVKQYTGLEQVLSSRLEGKAGSIETEVGRKKQPIPGGKEISNPAVRGCDATLTIDSSLQFEAQQLIQAQVDKTKARAGMVVAVDVQSGELLILADSATPDPAKPSGQTSGYTNSRAVENTFEPGSTGKVVTMAMLLEGGYATPDSPYRVPYQVTLGGQVYHDSSGHGTESLTLTGVLAKSSNVGTLLAAQGVPDQVRYDYLKKFGFGEPTGVELPAAQEAVGVVHKPGEPPKRAGDPYWDGRTANNVLFGQGVSANAVQATEVFATLGNGGVHVTPHLVKGWNCGSNGFEAAEPAEREQVVSEETASQLVQMMEAAVDSGTGKSAQVEGYRTAGKTGTSQMYEEGNKEIWVGSFVGLLPAEAPRFAIGVFIIDPKAEGYYGAVVAAPVFEQIAASMVDRYGVPPSTTRPTVLPLEW